MKKIKRIKHDHCCRLVCKTTVVKKPRKRLSASLRRSSNRGGNSSSESEKETCEVSSAGGCDSNGSSSTQDMSDYVLHTSDSDDGQPVKLQLKRHSSNVSCKGR